MAKQITRSIPVYTHECVKIENLGKPDQKISVEKIVSHVKMGTKLIKAELTKRGLEGYVLNGVTESEEKYSMSLEDFIAQAQKIN